MGDYWLTALLVVSGAFAGYVLCDLVRFIVTAIRYSDKEDDDDYE